MDAPDPLLALEHDHVHLSRLVAELRSLVRALGEGEPRPELRDDIVAVLSSIRDDLFDHFAREEEILFPYLEQALPELRESLARLEGAHDRICGGVSRLIALAEKGEALWQASALVGQLFERFDREYGEHARGESELLRGLAARLDDAQRRHVREIMRDA